MVDVVAKWYLALVGILYLGLSIWCSVDPATTSQKVGLERLGGSGRSEFLVIYGGLELAMALLLLMPLWDASWVRYSLITCIVIHACLVAYRVASYMLYTDIESMTHRLAIGEWVILLTSLACAWWSRKN